MNLALYCFGAFELVPCKTCLCITYFSMYIYNLSTPTITSIFLEKFDEPDNYFSCSDKVPFKYSVFKYHISKLFVSRAPSP